MQELKNKEAAVVVFSGGQDSTTCLFWALKRYKKVIALSFDYHQKHVKELECAKKICRDHEVEHHGHESFKSTCTELSYTRRY